MGCIGVVAFVAVTIGLGVLVNLFGGDGSQGQSQGQQHQKGPRADKPAVKPTDKPAPEKTTKKTPAKASAKMRRPERRVRAAAEAYYDHVEYTTGTTPTTT